MIRAGVMVSPKTVIPTMNAPTVPMPVQTVYAVLSGSVFIATDSNPKLAIIVEMVMAVGVRSVKPADFFIEKAQTISRIPAVKRQIQAMRDRLMPGRPA